jgi:hypothetical protein
LHRSARHHVLQHRQESARFDVRQHFRERPSKAPAASMPVAAAIQPSHVRTTSRSSVVKMPM